MARPMPASAQHHGDDLTSVGAERHPHSDLTCPLFDRVGGYTIEAHCSEHQSQGAE